MEIPVKGNGTMVQGGGGGGKEEAKLRTKTKPPFLSDIFAK